MIELLTATALVAALNQAPKPAEPAGIQVAVICFKSGEQTAGMNKICYYDCLGSQTAINISSVSICPLSINR